jgi:hypothetical protein
VIFIKKKLKGQIPRPYGVFEPLEVMGPLGPTYIIRLIHNNRGPINEFDKSTEFRFTFEVTYIWTFYENLIK